MHSKDVLDLLDELAVLISRASRFEAEKIRVEQRVDQTKSSEFGTHSRQTGQREHSVNRVTISRYSDRLNEIRDEINVLSSKRRTIEQELVHLESNERKKKDAFLELERQNTQVGGI